MDTKSHADYIAAARASSTRNADWRDILRARLDQRIAAGQFQDQLFAEAGTKQSLKWHTADKLFCKPVVTWRMTIVCMCVLQKTTPRRLHRFSSSVNSMPRSSARIWRF